MGSSRREERKEKTKKEKKKRRHRSRSKSHEREHKHRHHRKHRKHRSKQSKTPENGISPVSVSDISLSEQEVYQDDFDDKSNNGMQTPEAPVLSKYGKRPHSPETPPPPSLSERSPSLDAPPAPKIGRSDSPVSEISGGECGFSGKTEISLSIEETNRIRAKLGLKLLDVGDSIKKEPATTEGKAEVSEVKVDKATNEEFVHKPAVNIMDKVQVEKLREKIAAQREKRKIKEKMSQVKTLGESDEDDMSASGWVSKSRWKQKEKEQAEKKAKMLEELDAQFGVNDLVEEEVKHQKQRSYYEKHLEGLKVEHSYEKLSEGGLTILTLKDSAILDNEEDTLVNVNIMDDEKAAKNVSNKTKKSDSVEYEAPEVDDEGNIVQKTVLNKYDEEISGAKKESFRLGPQGEASVGDSAKTRLKKLSKLRNLESLASSVPQLVSEYLTPSEMLSFKKVKKTKNKRKKFSVDDLLPYAEDPSEHLVQRQIERNTDEIHVKSLKELTEAEELPKFEEVMEVDGNEETEESVAFKDTIELQEAIARSRRVKQAAYSDRGEEIMSQLIPRKLKKKEDPVKKSSEKDNDVMILNTTDEFCRTLGDIPTYGMSGNRLAGSDERTGTATSPDSQTRGTWEEVVNIQVAPVEITEETVKPILEEEPDASRGVADALRLAIKKGYLEKDNSKKTANAALQHLRAVHYSIEDKAMEDDRRSGRSSDRFSGPTMEFREKDSYKPDVKLEYVDDDGRKLNAKEAFRYLSHRFHGKGSGKNKTEKRMKKWNEELLMKHMSSSDTPLQTLEKQKEKQKQLGSAYLVLSGSKNQEALEVKK